jgi:hypothetical protein
MLYPEQPWAGTAGFVPFGRRNGESSPVVCNGGEPILLMHIVNPLIYNGLHQCEWAKTNKTNWMTKVAATLRALMPRLGVDGSGPSPGGWVATNAK